MWLVLTLSLLMIGIASGGFVRSLMQQRTLKMTRVYLAFCAIVGSIQLALLLFRSGIHYKTAYWGFEFAHNVLLCFLSAEIIKALLPRRFAILWSGIAFAIPLIMLIPRLPLKLPAALLNLSTSASFVGGILLLSLFLIPVNWTNEHRMATAGVFTLLVADFLSFFGSTGLIGLGQTSAVQLAPLPGLILLSLAGHPKRANKLKPKNAGQPPKMLAEDLGHGGHAA